MNYSELLDNFINEPFVPYSELLKTNEWKQKRNIISIRDNSTCTCCGLKQSLRFNDFNITFDSNDKLVSISLENFNKSIDYIKEKLNIKLISILRSPNNYNNFCGATENGYLFLVDWERIEGKSRDELVIFEGITLKGNKYFIMSNKFEDLSEYKFAVPLFTKNRIVMNVHHKYYVTDRLPWDYEDDALVMLCNWCHWKLHEETVVPIYSLRNNELVELAYTPCPRCNGTGELPQFSHVQGGTCFKCHGYRYEELILSRN